MLQIVSQKMLKNRFTSGCYVKVLWHVSVGHLEFFGSTPKTIKLWSRTFIKKTRLILSQKIMEVLFQKRCIAGDTIFKTLAFCMILWCFLLHLDNVSFFPASEHVIKGWYSSSKEKNPGQQICMQNFSYFIQRIINLLVICFMKKKKSLCLQSWHFLFIGLFSELC